MKTILEVQLDSFYGKRQVLSEIRFDLCQGEVLGLVGGSGAGKSSLVLSLLGLLPWRGGERSRRSHAGRAKSADSTRTRDAWLAWPQDQPGAAESSICTEWCIEPEGPL